MIGPVRGSAIDTIVKSSTHDMVGQYSRGNGLSLKVYSLVESPYLVSPSL